MGSRSPGRPGSARPGPRSPPKNVPAHHKKKRCKTVWSDTLCVCSKESQTKKPSNNQFWRTRQTKKTKKTKIPSQTRITKKPKIPSQIRKPKNQKTEKSK